MASASRNPNPLGHGTVQQDTGSGWTPRFIDNAYKSMTDSRRAQNHRDDVPAQGPLTDARMYASLNPTPCSGGGNGTFPPTSPSTFQVCGIAKDKLSKRNEGYPSGVTVHLETPLRTNPHSFPALSPNYCNATPLSTILEQGSAAELKHLSYSRSGGQSSDLRTAENISPTYAKTHGVQRLRQETSSEHNQPPRTLIQAGETCSGESYSLDAVAGSSSFANRCQPGMLQFSATTQKSDEGLVHETVQHIKHNPTSFISPSLSAEPRSHARSRNSCLAKVKPLTSEMNVTQPSESQNISACSITRSLSFSDLSDSKYGGTTGDMYAVPPNSCGAWLEHDLAKTTTLVQGNTELRSPNLLEAPPRCIDDHSQRISQNPSFCSTASTSYSATVLGIDLDIGYERQQRARCTDSPIWFTPIENIGKSSHVKFERKDILEEEKPENGHSITSVALSALLPIAAAEGIVRANLQTPRISFHSPSGNLILEENITTSLPRRWIHSKSYQRNYSLSRLGIPGRSRAWNALATAATDDYLQAPTPMPIATPSQMIASLPHHLRCENNENRAQLPRDPDVETAMQSAFTRTRINSKLANCGDVIVGTGPDDHCRIGTTRDIENHESSVLPRSRSEASRSRSLKFPIWHTTQKGRTPQKRRPPKRAGSGLGLVAGHLMRVCFCQPYDGVEAKSKKTATRGSLGDQYRNKKLKRAPCESQTPNTRIVDATLEK
ncbi:unnamed protein product [Periconia digitata]|uniref:Uncharacterized protein n=1 Tax=Periconia digitata TaxID=1303443 RepID=A0A9W4XMM5_9PLEO|nr:unnamed protein product [Periconia digitata]